ncbi:hypothetical protein [Streptomyces justiciae]|uniref:Multidrug transporter n=1 Tax=Streptomyces justiciae TaxID=2780140 RepID=A0ABU3M769_9ACTN|nr:hypothetical protein [Streptomyces justiciae]MDT7847193.1 hypothetical protein [Streptomyces justiciae]
MPRITLAHWHDGRAPGTELDVDDDELRQLTRDGRVATVTDAAIPVSDGTPVAEAPGVDGAAAEAPAEDATEAEAAESAPKRRRR